MQCSYCERGCRLTAAYNGYCGMYKIEGDQVVEAYPRRWSSYMSSNIEQIPFYHVYPGSKSLVVGSMGCNMDCQYCINAYVAKGKADEPRLLHLAPEKIIQAAEVAGCQSIVFGVNEVTVSLPSFLELAVAARNKGFEVGCLTNGYFTLEAAKLLMEHVSFVNLSFKSISADFYRQYANINTIEPIIRNMWLLAEQVHLEVTTPIVQGINDHEIIAIASLIKGINPNIPWHLFRLLPQYKMEDQAYPSVEGITTELGKAREILPYVYFSNFIGSDWVSTHCLQCGTKLIHRISLGACGGKLVKDRRLAGKCPTCGFEIAVLGNCGQERKEAIV